MSDEILKGKRLAHGQFVVNNLQMLIEEHTGTTYETLEDKIGFCVELVHCIEEVQLELESRVEWMKKVNNGEQE